jgi:hypothetical protein
MPAFANVHIGAPRGRGGSVPPEENHNRWQGRARIRAREVYRMLMQQHLISFRHRRRAAHPDRPVYWAAAQWLIRYRSGRVRGGGGAVASRAKIASGRGATERDAARQ